MNYKLFPSPPIIEALVDIRVESNPKISLTEIEKLFETLKSEYPQKNILSQHQIKFGPIGQQAKAEATELKNGFLAKSKDEKKVIQFRIDGFTFSFLNFYQEWNLLKSESHKLWTLYEKLFQPTVIRVATKYINKIIIPESFFSLDDYFLNLPRVNSKKLGYLENFMLRYSLEREGLKANIGLGNIPVIEEKPVTAFLFDIDVYKLSTESGDKIWSNLDLLNKYADDIFFESLTEKAGELFK